MAETKQLPGKGAVTEDSSNTRQMPGVGTVTEAQAAGANPHNPFGHPLRGPFGGPIG